MNALMLYKRWGVDASAIATGGNGPDGTQNYVAVTIQASQVPSALTDYPAYVRMSDLPAAFWSSVQADGGDIRVTEDDGTTRAPVDLEAIDTGGNTGELHFKASSVSASSNTTYRVYYNATSTLSQPAVGDTYGRNAVWSDYELVLHDGGGTDAAGNYDGTAGGGVTFGGAAGQVGDATEYDGTDDRSNHGDGIIEGELTTTISAWIKPDAVSGNQRIFHKNGTLSAFLPSEVPGGFRVVNYEDLKQAVTYSGVIGTGVWHHVLATVVWKQEAQIYVNGTDEYDPAESNPDAPTTGPTPDSADPAYVGADEDLSTNWYDGAIDELRVCTVHRSSAWASAEHANQSDPSTFYSIGSEQAA